MTSSIHTIAIYPASSITGSACVSSLLSSLSPNLIVRAIFRSATKAASLQEAHGSNPNLQILTGVDASDPSSLRTAFSKCTMAYLITPSASASDVSIDAQLVNNMMHAAVNAGVRHIIFGASWTVFAKEELPGLSGRFAPGEELLKQLEKEHDLRWTILRGGFYFNNFHSLLAGLKKEDLIRLMNMRIPPNDPRDIGRVAAAVVRVAGKGHEGKIYEISGPEELGTGDLVRICGEVLERDVRLEEVAVEEFVKPFPEYLKELFVYLAKGGKVPISKDVKMVTGEEPVGFKEWMQENKAAFEKI